MYQGSSANGEVADKKGMVMLLLIGASRPTQMRVVLLYVVMTVSVV
jgi:hypothetical protein